MLFVCFNELLKYFPCLYFIILSAFFNIFIVSVGVLICGRKKLFLYLLNPGVKIDREENFEFVLFFKEKIFFVILLFSIVLLGVQKVVPDVFVVKLLLKINELYFEFLLFRYKCFLLYPSPTLINKFDFDVIFKK